MEKIKAFTLVELSIVLVIIGLLTAGVVGGQSLVESAKQRAVVSEFNSFDVVFRAFQLEYSSKPGDMTDAALYWTSCVDSGANTCNGNGDGVILNDEELRAWQHLGLSGILSGNYTGITNTTPRFKTGTNVPLSKYGNSGFRMSRSSVYGKTANAINFSNVESNTSYWFAVMTTKSASGVDKKMDDGLADSGKLIGINGYVGSSYTTDCVANSSQWAAPATYKLGNSTVSCALNFWLE